MTTLTQPKTQLKVCHSHSTVLFTVTTPHACSLSKLRKPIMSSSLETSLRRRRLLVSTSFPPQISTFGRSRSPSCSVTLDKRMLTTSARSCGLATKYQQFLKKSRKIVFTSLQSHQLEVSSFRLYIAVLFQTH